MNESRGNTYYVLRHGEAEQNVLGIVYGKSDDNYALTPAGKEQVKAAAQNLSGITKIYCSPIRRARESAEIAASVLNIPATDIEVDKRLRELNFGIFQGKPIGEFIKYRDEHIHSYDDVFPEGESYLDARRRFGDWLYETDAKLSHENVLIVTHGIGIESLVSVAKGMSNDEALAFVRNHTFTYAYMTSFTFTPTKVDKDFAPIA
jgi:broad specificity phosphatase PhoE